MAKKNIDTTKKVNLRPLMGYLLVAPVAAESKTASGIYLPESAQEKPAGQGVAIGGTRYAGYERSLNEWVLDDMETTPTRNSRCRLSNCSM
jgi:hypothetical protein